jgi:hypothetical protein
MGKYMTITLESRKEKSVWNIKESMIEEKVNITQPKNNFEPRIWINEEFSTI